MTSADRLLGSPSTTRITRRPNCFVLSLNLRSSIPLPFSSLHTPKSPQSKIQNLKSKISRHRYRRADHPQRWVPRIEHPFQEQSGRGRRPFRRQALSGLGWLGGDQLLEGPAVQLSGADLDERADDPAHHLPEEVRSRDADEDQRAVRRDLDLVDDDDRARLLGRLLGEETEIVTAGEEGGGRAHAPVVERAVHPPDPALGDRRGPTRNL